MLYQFFILSCLTVSSYLDQQPGCDGQKKKITSNVMLKNNNSEGNKIKLEVDK